MPLLYPEVAAIHSHFEAVGVDAERTPGMRADPQMAAQAPAPDAGAGGSAQMQQAHGDAAAAATATLGAAGGLGDTTDATPQPQSQPPADAQREAAAAPAAQRKREDASSGAAEAAAAAAQANPFRSLGDAREAWRRSVAAAADAADEGGAGGGDDDAAGDEAMDVAFERSREGDDERGARQQALGAATQEQVDAQAGMHGVDGADGDAAPPDDEAAADIAPAVAETDGQDVEMEDDEDAAAGAGLAGAAQARSQAGAGAQGGEGVDGDDAEMSTEEPDLLAQALQQRSEDAAGQGLVEVQDAQEPAEDAAPAAPLPPPRPLAAQDEGADGVDAARGRAAFQRCSAATAALTGELVEQLRLVLQPTAANRMSGDYKTGKRLNMKKVISFIASGFRQDKIWLRRTKPDKRQYQLVLAIDETRSMQVRLHNPSRLFSHQPPGSSSACALPDSGKSSEPVRDDVCHVCRRISVQCQRWRRSRCSPLRSRASRRARWPWRRLAARAARACCTRCTSHGPTRRRRRR